MTDVVSTRLDEKEIEELNEISVRERIDRSSLIRKRGRPCNPGLDLTIGPGDRWPLHPDRRHQACLRLIYLTDSAKVGSASHNLPSSGSAAGHRTSDPVHRRAH